MANANNRTQNPGVVVGVAGERRLALGEPAIGNTDGRRAFDINLFSNYLSLLSLLSLSLSLSLSPSLSLSYLSLSLSKTVSPA